MTLGGLIDVLRSVSHFPVSVKVFVTVAIVAVCAAGIGLLWFPVSIPTPAPAPATAGQCNIGSIGNGSSVQVNCSENNFSQGEKVQ
jgi:hypothetical protein